jgi:hypothetical protein
MTLQENSLKSRDICAESNATQDMIEFPLWISEMSSIVLSANGITICDLLLVEIIADTSQIPLILSLLLASLRVTVMYGR